MTTLLTRLAAPTALMAGLVVAGCGGSSSPDPYPTTAAPAKVAATITADADAGGRR